MSSVSSKPNQSLRSVAIGIALLSVLFAVGLGILIFHMVRPRGERVGETSLLEPRATLLVNAKQGDSLVFRVDASMRVARISLLGDDQLEREMTRQLARSMLTVRAALASGTEHVATCPLYKGRAVSTTSTSGSFSRTGMLNDCVIVLVQPGNWTVRASVAWSSELEPTSATLETRLETRER
jgi:hypothetical protein